MSPTSKVTFSIQRLAMSHRKLGPRFCVKVLNLFSLKPICGTPLAAKAFYQKNLSCRRYSQISCQLIRFHLDFGTKVAVVMVVEIVLLAMPRSLNCRITPCPSISREQIRVLDYVSYLFRLTLISTTSYG